MSKEVIYELGLQEVSIQIWDDINECYVGDILKLAGDHKITYKPSNSSTMLASGDDPAWAVVSGTTKYEGTLSIYSLSQEVRRRLFSVLLSKSNGLLVGDTNATARFVGLIGDNKVVENGVPSVNRIVFYKVHFEEPEITNETSDEDGPNTADLEIDFTAYPVPYQMTDGSYAGRCGIEVNSLNQPDAFTALNTSITMPSAAELEDLVTDEE